MKLLLSLSVLLLSFTANADDFCQQNLLPILKQAYPAATVLTSDDNAGEAYRLELNDEYKRAVDLGYSTQALCKVWPAKPELTLLAIKLDHFEEEPQGWAAATADLEILVVSTQSKQILARLVQPDALFSDAIIVDYIALDTPRYHLNDNITAFGVTVKRSSRSSPNPYNSKALSLFQFNDNQMADKKISLLVDNLVVSQFGGESDTHCAGEFWQTKRILIIDKAQEKAPNLSPITVKTQIKHYRSVYDGESTECIDQTIDIKKQSSKLHFDGTHYPVPANIQYHF